MSESERADRAADKTAREGQGSLFERLRGLLGLGAGSVRDDIEDALEGISTRMASQDFAWIVMAIRIHREVGGNLAEILSTVAATIRERERLRRQVRGLSAEGRLSAWILGGLPPIFATYLILVRPTYIEPLFTDPLGITLVIVMLALMSLGIFWLSRVVKVKV